MVADGRRVGLRERRSPIRALAAVLPFVAAACSAFGLESTSAPPATSTEAGADDMDADQAEGGSGTDDGDVRPDAAALPDAASCTPTVVVKDGFEGSWNAATNWEPSMFMTGSLKQTPNARPGGGTYSVQFVTSTGDSHARLGKGLHEACALRFDAWLFVQSHNSTDSRILAIATKDGATMSVQMRDGKLALVEGTTDKGVVSLPSQQWRRLVFTYTSTGTAMLALDGEQVFASVGNQPAARVDFGLLGAVSGSDDILVDDVELTY